MDQSLIDQYRLYGNRFNQVIPNPPAAEEEKLVSPPLPPIPKWEMSQQVSDYFANQYKNNPLANIDYAIGAGSPLLNPEQFVPFFHEGEPIDERWKDIYWQNAGYTYPGEEELYLKNLNYAGHQVDPIESLLIPEDPKAGSRAAAMAEQQNRIAMEMAQEETQKQQDFADWESGNIARTGVHESIHANLLDRESKEEEAKRLRLFPNSTYHEGAYSNAIAEMLKGTTALGIPADKTKYLGKRIYGPPNINDQYIESPYSSNYEQNELLTQALTELLSPKQPNPNMPANAHVSSPIEADYPWAHWNMDKPGGPMTQEGLENFLFEKVQPLYEQILSDAEKGYIQNSIWHTP